MIALFLAACGGGGTSLLVAPSEDAAMNTDSPDNTSDEDTDKPDSSDTSETQDTDGDGVGDNSDAFPHDPLETVDTDNDGTGDNTDAFPNDASETLDSDGDGVGDNSDAFPNDASETLDSDSDGIGDNIDAFPNDASETLDSDGDGVGDNSDAFPHDPLETVDTDNDGTGDNSDAFPNDASETLDSDGDGVGDNSDAFPNDASETLDSDNDGTGDNSDAFPNDASETLDSDKDGVGDNSDAFTTSRATVQGTSAVDLLDYLKDHASGGPWGPPWDEWQREPKIPLWMHAPTVQVESSAAPEFHRMTAKAVDLINDWLPLEYRMRMGAPTALRPDNTDDVPDGVPDGVIHVNFRYTDGGRMRPDEIRDFSDPNDVPAMRAAIVDLDPGPLWQHNIFWIIVHELVHAMGIMGHVSPNRHPTTIMPDVFTAVFDLPYEAGLPQLPRIDGEALMAAYTIFNEGHTPDEINPTSLGPWASTIPAIHGEVRTDGGTAGFGVEYRTQWTRAWDEGPAPATTLTASNLTGTATWTGELVGFTDAGTAVEGVAGITVDVGRMDGTAAFTDLVSDDASWGPDLSSDINVNGNYFIDTGSEPRIDLEGQFRGASHEAATGVFRWEDSETGNLTGAFGTIWDE